MQMLKWVLALSVPVCLLVACGGGGGDGSSANGNTLPPTNSAPQTYRVGGQMSGLPAGSQATVRIGANNVLIKENGAFVAADLFDDGATYTTRIAASDRHCVVRNGNGTIRGANVSTIAIDCHRGQAWVTDGLVRTQTLSPDGRTLYIAGDFRRVGRIPSALVSVDPVSGAPNPVAESFTGEVTAMLPDESGGLFVALLVNKASASAPTAHTRLLHLDASGRPDPVFGISVHGAVYAMARRGDLLYVGGTLSLMTPPNQGGLLALNARTGLPTGFNLGISDSNNASIQAMAVVGDKLYIGGTFGSIGKVSSLALAAVNLDTGAVVPLSLFRQVKAFVLPAVYALAYENGRLFVGGDFTEVGGQVRNGLAVIDPVTGSVAPWDAASPEGASFQALYVDGNRLYAGGWATGFADAGRVVLAAMDAGTGSAVIWAPQLFQSQGNRPRVRSIGCLGNAVYLAGDWSHVNGVARPSLAAVAADDGRLLPFAEGQLDRGATRVSVTNGRIWVGGSFTLYGAAQREGLAALDTETGELKSWQPKAGYQDAEVGPRVRQMQALDTAVALAGSFTRVGGVTRNGFALVDTTEGKPLPFDADLPIDVEAFALSDSTLFIGGLFSSFGGVPRTNLAAIDRKSLSIRPWAPAAGITSALGFAGGRLFSAERNEMVAYNADQSATPLWRKTVGSGEHAYVSFIAAMADTVFTLGTTMRDGSLVKSFVALDAATGAMSADWAPPPRNMTQIFTCGDSLFGMEYVYKNDIRSEYLRMLDKRTGSQSSTLMSSSGPISSVQCGADTFYIVGEFDTVYLSEIAGSDALPRQHTYFRSR